MSYMGKPDPIAPVAKSEGARERVRGSRARDSPDPRERASDFVAHAPDVSVVPCGLASRDDDDDDDDVRVTTCVRVLVGVVYTRSYYER